jgi:hypothetical protein
MERSACILMLMVVHICLIESVMGAYSTPAINHKKIQTMKPFVKKSAYIPTLLYNGESGNWSRSQPTKTMVGYSHRSFQRHNMSNDERDLKLKSFQKDIEDKLSYEERTYDNMGPLMPLAEKLDAISGDWALSYADLSPATPKTPAGVAFLATNACYACAGLALGINGDFLLGGLTEIAGIVSFWYHYSQLEFGKDRSEVRLALLTDYITAGSALITGGAYMAQMGITGVPIDALITGAVAIVCLSLCWVWEFGYPYLFWHSLWHIFSAYTGFLVGQAHLT